MIIFAYCYLADIFVIAYMSVCPSVYMSINLGPKFSFITYRLMTTKVLCIWIWMWSIEPWMYVSIRMANVIACQSTFHVGGRSNCCFFCFVFLKAPLRNYFLTESSPDKHQSDDTFCFDLEYICTNIEKVRDQITTQYKWQVIIRSFFANIYLFIRCCFLSDCGSFLLLNAEIGAIYDASYTQFRLLTIKISLFFPRNIWCICLQNNCCLWP